MSETTSRPAKAAGELAGMLLPELKKVAAQLGIEGAANRRQAHAIKALSRKSGG